VQVGTGPGTTLPLSALLSHALVAFTIEADNDFERELPHRTTRHGRSAAAPGAPWLVSLAMWANCLQFVTPAGMTVRELELAARTPTNLDGMRRWGYLDIDPAPPAGGSKKPRLTAVLRPTGWGTRAQDAWRPLPSAVEERWKTRFGAAELAALRSSLAGLARGDLPDCLPILGYGLYCRGPGPGAGHDAGGRELPFYTLLSRVLLAFALEYEAEAELSLAISANLLRVLGPAGRPVRDLPELAGVSKEAISAAASYLQRHSYAALEPAPPPGRGQVLRLTGQGAAAQQLYQELPARIEERWQAASPPGIIGTLRRQLERLTGPGDGPGAGRPWLMSGLEPPPGSWRAATGTPRTLPHFPMVLHRGGFPDGS
jgi:hypothetical protein